jgi:hypothetical protein
MVAWQTTSSEPQFEHTGVERARRPVRSSTVRGTSGIKLNGLMSAVRRIFFVPFCLIFGSQPTPAMTLRKVTNCEVAHFVVDGRRAAEGKNKKAPGVNGGPASQGHSNRCRRQTERADHSSASPARSGAPICSSKPSSSAAAGSFRFVELWGVNHARLRWPAMQEISLIHRAAERTSLPDGSGSRFNPDRTHKD